MKTRVLFSLVSLSVVFIAFITFGPKKGFGSPTEDMMRQKLSDSQNVLKGLVLEDFALVLQSAERLGVISVSRSILPSETPYFVEQSAAFQKNVRNLIQAARNKDLKASTDAYVKSTLNCVECHKAIRGKKVAQLGAIGSIPR